MNTIWSTKIQGIKTLDAHRDYRFNEENMALYMNKINVDPNIDILEIGCGPGTFTRKLAELMPESAITGLDLDSSFIDYCLKLAEKKSLSNVQFKVGDALDLPFKDNTFNLCTSHTVIEHLPNLDFLKEQYRVLKKGGKIVVMNVQMDQIITSKEVLKPSLRTLDLLDQVSEALDKQEVKKTVGKYFANPQEVLKSMELVGFKDIELHALTDVRCLDDAKLSHAEKIQMIRSELDSQYEFIEMAMKLDYPPLTNNEYKELKSLIKTDFDKRIKMIDTGERLWDFTITPLIMLIGRK